MKIKINFPPGLILNVDELPPEERDRFYADLEKQREEAIKELEGVIAEIDELQKLPPCKCFAASDIIECETPCEKYPLNSPRP